MRGRSSSKADTRHRHQTWTPARDRKGRRRGRGHEPHPRRTGDVPGYASVGEPRMLTRWYQQGKASSQAHPWPSRRCIRGCCRSSRSERMLRPCRCIRTTCLSSNWPAGRRRSGWRNCFSPHSPTSSRAVALPAISVPCVQASLPLRRQPPPFPATSRKRAVPNPGCPMLTGPSIKPIAISGRPCVNRVSGASLTNSKRPTNNPTVTSRAMQP
jgi:hypothetical protein